MGLDIEAIKARAEAATPGPWYWGGNLSFPGGIDLRARVSNTPIVMQFRRWGNGGEPCFWKRDRHKDPAMHGEHQRGRDIAVREVPYRDDVVALDNADAEFIAHARTDVPALVAEVERLRQAATDLADALSNVPSEALLPGELSRATAALFAFVAADG